MMCILSFSRQPLHMCMCMLAPRKCIDDIPHKKCKDDFMLLVSLCLPKYASQVVPCDLTLRDILKLSVKELDNLS